MTSYLLDVNILISLLDPGHTQHSRAARWFEFEGSQDWLTCPTTQLVAVRIMSGRHYSEVRVVPPAYILDSLSDLTALGNHRFVPDNVDIVTSPDLNRESLLASKMVTDTYLILVAKRHDAHLATFDRRLVSKSVKGGETTVSYIP